MSNLSPKIYSSMKPTRNGPAWINAILSSLTFKAGVKTILMTEPQGVRPLSTSTQCSTMHHDAKYGEPRVTYAQPRRQKSAHMKTQCRSWVHQLHWTVWLDRLKYLMCACIALLVQGTHIWACYHPVIASSMQILSLYTYSWASSQGDMMAVWDVSRLQSLHLGDGFSYVQFLRSSALDHLHGLRDLTIHICCRDQEQERESLKTGFQNLLKGIRSLVRLSVECMRYERIFPIQTICSLDVA